MTLTIDEPVLAPDVSPLTSRAAMPKSPDELNDAVADLYQRRPSEFITARKALARALRDARRRDDAQAVQALRRPTVAAWALNRLCRTHRDRLSELLDLAVLRQAQAQALVGRGAHDDRSEAQRVMRDRVLPAINRPEDVLRERLPIGPAEAFAERLAAFRDAGVQRVFIWPVADEIDQLRRFHEEVAPLLDH